MEIVDDDVFQAEISLTLQRVFQSLDPYAVPFSEQAEYRTILFPYDYEMEPPLLDIIRDTARDFGEHFFYYSILGMNESEGVHVIRTWRVPFQDYQHYVALNEPVLNVIYSPHGRWGILASQESHGLLGGNVDFFDVVRHRFPDIDQQAIAFIDNWKGYAYDYQVDIAWLKPLLEHVYGSGMAFELLKLLQT
jgi:hypothetical protein